MNRENLGAASTSEAFFNNDCSIHTPTPEFDTVLSEGRIYYAITIKCVTSETQYEEDFNTTIDRRLVRFIIHTKVWELDKKGKLHCHLLASGSSKIRYKLIHQYGWHLYIVPLTTEEDKYNWEKYLLKDRKTDVLLSHTSNHKNMFDMMY